MKATVDNPRIVVISSDDDAHVPFVTPYLSSRCILVDPVAVAKGEALSFHFKDGKVHASYKGMALDRIACVWYRKPDDITAKIVPVPEAYSKYSVSALDRFTKLLRASFREALWVSDYYAIARANSKELQLEVASSLGFNVPEAVITSDPKEAEKFLARHERSIIKSMATVFPTTDKTYFFFAKQVTSQDKIDLSNLHLAPAIFQRAIRTVADWRITVIGNKVFAAKIVAPTTKGVRDWRLGHTKGDLVFQAADSELPNEIRSQCIKLVRRLGLRYGAIDLVQDPSGTFWFLEINPNGQWAFVEEQTGQPIGKAFADFFEKAVARERI